MALVIGRTKKYNLAGTLINAIRHHQDVDDPDLEDKVIAYVNRVPGKPGLAGAEDDAWIRGQIQRCIDKLSE